MNLLYSRKTWTLGTLLLFHLITHAQPRSAESQGIAGIRSVASGHDALWHNYAFSTSQDGTVFHASSSIPFMTPDLVLSGVAAGHRTSSGKLVGLRLKSSLFPSYQYFEIDVLYAMSLSPSSSIGVSLGQIFERFDAEKRTSNSYSLAFAHEVSNSVKVGLLVIDPIPLTEHRADSGSFHFGVKWSVNLIDLFCEVAKRSTSKLATRWGLIYQPVHALAIRFGVSTNPTSVHLGFGLPLTSLFDVHLAIAYHMVLGITPTLSVHYPGS